MIPPLPRRAVARDISRVANASVSEVLATLGDRSAAGSGRRIGVTGPPGAGKSTLIAALAGHRADAGVAPLGVLAIDPTSPLSGGSILGDRIRMDRIAGLPGLFLRSLPSRSARNGLCDNLEDLFAVFDLHGFAEVIVETVGVGQAEIEVQPLVDTVVLVIPPDAGDSIQAMKAGILELADIIVVSRGASPGAARMASDIAAVQDVRRVTGQDDWQVPVLRCDIDGSGIAELSAAIDAHAACHAARGTEASRDARRLQHLRALVLRRLDEVLENHPPEPDADLAAAFNGLVARLRT